MVCSMFIGVCLNTSLTSDCYSDCFVTSCTHSWTLCTQTTIAYSSKMSLSQSWPELVWVTFWRLPTNSGITKLVWGAFWRLTKIVWSLNLLDMNPIKHLWDMVVPSVNMKDPELRINKELWRTIKMASINISLPIF